MSKSIEYQKNIDKLTVFIPTYNEEKNIEACIDSIRANGVSKIVIIDSSENNLTKELADQKKVPVLKEEKNLSRQRQRAIDYCDTEFLMFVDADDRLSKDCIDTLFNEMIQFGYDAIETRKRVIDPYSYWQKGLTSILSVIFIFRLKQICLGGIRCIKTPF